MMKFNKNNAITLIALVITIVILLVLAGITIATLGGENALLARAKQAKQAQTESEMKEQLMLVLQDLQIEKLGGATLDDITQEWIDSKIQDYECIVEEDASISGKKIIMKKDGVTFKFSINENLNIIATEESKSTAELEYETISRDGEKVKILITITDTENGLQQVEFPDGTILYCNGEEQVAKDYEVALGVENVVKITSKDGQVKEETIIINDYYHKITKNLGEGIIIDNPAIKAAYNKPYQATITTENGNMISVLTVTMGGESVEVNKTTGTINIEKVTGDIEITAMAGNVIVASGDTNEETGEVTLNLEKYVDQAESGDIIYIPAGTYVLDQIVLDVYSGFGITDKGKEITFVGKNEQTVLIYEGAKSTARDGCIMQLDNQSSVVRNMVIEYYPGKSNNYSNAFFRGTFGTIQNVYIHVKGNISASYSYSGIPNIPNIKNCTFYHDLGSIMSDYSGSPVYTNIATNVQPPNGTFVNLVLNDFGGDITATKDIDDIVNAKAGVYYGDYAWE